jgi:hypothetical protein
MAITKTIEIDVNSQGAVGGINNVTNSIEQTDKATKSLKAQLKEATLEVQKLADEFGATSKEVIEASKRAADLKDRIEDANDSILAFKGEGAFNATAKALGSVASGFSAVEGAIVLAGGQSEEFQETMLKLQGAMALAQGLEGLEDAGRSFKQLGAVAKNALAGIRTGIAATGIGVLLVALGAVVAYWDDIKEAVGGVSDEQEALNEKSQKNLDVEQKKLDSFSLQENSLRLQGKSERDILQMKVKQTNEIIKASEIQIEQSIATTKAQTETAKRNQEILAGTLKFLSLPLTMILKTVDLVGKALGKDFGLEEKVFSGLASFVFDPKEVQAEGDAAVAEQRKALAKLKSDRDGFQLSINNIDKQAYETRKALKDKEFQEDLDRINKQSAIVSEGKIKSLEIQNKDIEDLKTFGALKLEETQKTLDQQIAAEKAASDAKTEIAKREAEAKLAMLNAVSGGLSLAASELGESTAAGKIAAVAAASISTYTAIAGQLAAFSGVPIPGYAIAQAIVTGATGLLQVKKILSVKTPKGGGGGGGASISNASAGGGASSTPVPQFNVVGNSGVNQIAATLGAQQPVQAYVVANQVTTQQALDRNIVQNASLG